MKYIRVKSGSSGMKQDRMSNTQLKVVILKKEKWDKKWYQEILEKHQDELINLLLTIMKGVDSHLEEYDEPLSDPLYANIYTTSDAEALSVVFGYKLSKNFAISVAECRLNIVKEISKENYFSIYITTSDPFKDVPSWEKTSTEEAPILSFEKNEILKYLQIEKNKKTVKKGGVE